MQCDPCSSIFADSPRSTSAGCWGRWRGSGWRRRLRVGPGGWPWATFAVNMAGALLLGYFFARLRDHPEDSLAPPVPHHRDLRHADHLLDPPAGAVRDGRRRAPRPRRRLLRRRRSPAGYLCVRLGIALSAGPEAAAVSARGPGSRSACSAVPPPAPASCSTPPFTSRADAPLPARDPRGQPRAAPWSLGLVAGRGAATARR